MVDRPTDPAGPGQPAPRAAALPEARGARETHSPVTAHGCWYPSADPSGRQVAFICNRGGVPQLWTGPADGEDAHLLDTGPDPVTEVSWSPDGRWIAYTTAPGGGELTRVLCVRPDGSDRRVLAGAASGSTAYLGRWSRDGALIAVTATDPPTGLLIAERGAAGPALLGGAHRGELGRPGAAGPAVLRPAGPAPGAAADEPHLTGGGLAVFLADPAGVRPAELIATEPGGATLRVCDSTADGRLVLLLRGPRGGREAVVLRSDGRETAYSVRVADGDPWVGRFSPDGRRLYLRSDADREFAALVTVELGPDGSCLRRVVTAGREDADLELLSVADDGRTAVLAWNVRGRTELETVALPAAPAAPAEPAAPAAPAPAAPAPSAPAPELAARVLTLPHEVVTRISPAGPRGLALAVAGSRRRPGVWHTPDGASPLRTPWSSRDEDVVAPGQPAPVRPEHLRLRARDGLELGGWYYRAPRREPDGRGPCVIHLHGGPEQQERPVFEPLYHELLGHGLDVFAPDVRGSLGAGRSFVNADLGEGRFAAIDDVADCAAHLITLGVADARRLAVMGHSYGGYLTLASLVWHPELFRTGVSVCGMSDFLTFFAGTEPWIARSAAVKYGHPERDRDLLHALSPMSRIDALRVPVLTVHGEHDTNVPPGESEQLVRAARQRGIPAELLLLAGEGHEFRRTRSRVLFRRTAADWIERHLAVE
ncbi:alpha/beta fold hydrolase [Kitasatospora sp. NBC_01250]|uniref:S9 family peptidase n=1 Tax=Kitasatospora sp. NBC_01250 TaxID=2903571 RepID=UPI002E2F392A|nr:alpha/beta fold hydrolase [Kitasatospora sp. NBC_01250]